MRSTRSTRRASSLPACSSVPRARVRASDGGGRHFGVEIDPKRPYGDMAYFEIDMARILGIVADGPPSAERADEREFSPLQLQHFAPSFISKWSLYCRCFSSTRALHPGTSYDSRAGTGVGSAPEYRASQRCPVHGSQLWATVGGNGAPWFGRSGRRVAERASRARVLEAQAIAPALTGARQERAGCRRAASGG